MKAVVYEKYGGPEVLQIKEMDKPEVKSGEVLIKTGGSGINPVDTYFRKGIRQVESFPHIPHFDIAGTVEAAGDNVPFVKEGDRVWATNVPGTGAEYVIAPAESVFPLPEHLTDADGAALAMPLMTAHLSLHYRARLQPDETVLVYGGAGAVGNAAIQLAKACGANVIATAGSKEKADICKEAGADSVILYKEENVVEKVNEITGGKGVHIILDMSLSENLESNLHMIETGGRIVTIGSPQNNTPELPWRLLNQKHASLLGVLLFTAPKEELRRAGEEITTLLEKKKIHSHIGKVFTFEEAAKAHRALENHEYNGSIVLTP
ncbi:NADPH:quinone reductase [Evansella sp. LMS18]|jgi:NADPH2:quinone reductase|uniref:NADPH:quinone reductase n=1 Tax=Evansella sp. LMS18 TaxID=2924033 RepID=UPI0020D104FA|nr:NADPH:quinone reductase [Evansella sp. LMS18]UTR09050.1 NADPH:quinone reductase [Evansella sp. LMS18]